MPVTIQWQLCTRVYQYTRKNMQLFLLISGSVGFFNFKEAFSHYTFLYVVLKVSVTFVYPDLVLLVHQTKPCWSSSLCLPCWNPFQCDGILFKSCLSGFCQLCLILCHCVILLFKKVFKYNCFNDENTVSLFCSLNLGWQVPDYLKFSVSSSTKYDFHLNFSCVYLMTPI